MFHSAPRAPSLPQRRPCAHEETLVLLQEPGLVQVPVAWAMKERQHRNERNLELALGLQRSKTPCVQLSTKRNMPGM
eukprot:11940408-Alexandrium_andersonii.AAC.1